VAWLGAFPHEVWDCALNCPGCIGRLANAVQAFHSLTFRRAALPRDELSRIKIGAVLRAIQSLSGWSQSTSGTRRTALPSTALRLSPARRAGLASVSPRRFAFRKSARMLTLANSRVRERGRKISGASFADRPIVLSLSLSQ
jgi:hypothetical protein